jgi:methylated-DNA-[protein]-cysteine S-methyltransferase
VNQKDNKGEAGSRVHVAVASDTPIGPIWVARSQQGLVAIEIGGFIDQFTERLKGMGFKISGSYSRNCLEVIQQIGGYLDGKRRTFNLAIDWSVTTCFQKQVFGILLKVPFGEVITYGEIAHRLGNPKAARAVGRAGATNPIPIVIPCHRVIGADGKLHGYRAPKGMETKAWLLALERHSLNIGIDSLQRDP